jgi:hypothetical protein
MALRSFGVALVVVEGAAAGGEVGAGTEAAAGAGDDDDADLIVGIGALQGVDQFALHDGGVGVEFFRAIERERQDPVLDIVEDLGIGGIHGECGSFRGERGSRGIGPPGAGEADFPPRCPKREVIASSLAS